MMINAHGRPLTVDSNHVHFMVSIIPVSPPGVKSLPGWVRGPVKGLTLSLCTPCQDDESETLYLNVHALHWAQEEYRKLCALFPPELRDLSVSLLGCHHPQRPPVPSPSNPQSLQSSLSPGEVAELERLRKRAVSLHNVIEDMRRLQSEVDTCRLHNGECSTQRPVEQKEDEDGEVQILSLTPPQYEPPCLEGK